MAWWGKVIGGTLGFVAGGGPIGALLGAAIGHAFDKGMSGLEQLGPLPTGENQERVQAAFFTATFSIMGHIAKADGQVSKDEIEVAEHTMARMQLDDEQKAAAKRLFSEGKASDFDYAGVAGQLRQECGRRKNLLQMFMEIQLATALADGELHPSEQGVLLELAEQLGFHRRQFEQLLAMATAQQRFSHGFGGHSSHNQAQSPGQSLADAYKVLGLNEDCSDAELKRAYRKLISQHHPDKLVSKGLPEEMMKIATDKTREIKDAYDFIKQQRTQNS